MNLRGFWITWLAATFLFAVQAWGMSMNTAVGQFSPTTVVAVDVVDLHPSSGNASLQQPTDCSNSRASCTIACSLSTPPVNQNFPAAVVRPCIVFTTMTTRVTDALRSPPFHPPRPH